MESEGVHVSTGVGRDTDTRIWGVGSVVIWTEPATARLELFGSNTTWEIPAPIEPPSVAAGNVAPPSVLR